MIERLELLGIVHCFGGGGGSSGVVSETEAERSQAEINTKLWDHYVTNYKPEIEKYTALRTSSEVAAGESRQVSGQVNAEIMQNAPQGSTNLAKSTRTLSNLAKIGTSAQVEGQGASRSRTIGGLQNIIDIGRGQATTAQEGTSALATQAISTEAATARRKLSQEIADSAAKATMVGAGLGAAVKYGAGKGLTPEQTLIYERRFQDF